MKSYMKVLGLLSVVMAALLIVPAALAVTWDVDLEVDDQEVDGSTTLYVERGETLNLRVAVTGTLGATETADMLEDLRLRAWVGGYEPDVLEAKTAMFDPVDGATRTFRLSLELPEDLDAADSYTLHVDVLNGDIASSSEYDLAVERSRHLVTVQDVTVSPSSTLKAGDSLWTTVRLENMGSRKEEDVRVTVSVPALGLSARTFVDELGMSEEDDDGEPETSESAQPLMLQLPANAAAGEYEMVVEVSYNRGRDVVTASKTLTVSGSAASSSEDSEEESLQAVVSVYSTTQSVAQGGEAVFKITFANLGDETQLFSVKAAGTQLWADTRVDPSFVSVGPSETGEVYLYISAHEDAEVGNHLFTLQIKSGDNLVKEVALGAKVTATEAPASGSELLSASTLKLGFVGLVVLLVVIGLIVALRKLKDDDEYPLEPKDGQTYY